MKKSTLQTAFTNLRILVGIFVFLAGVFLALTGFGMFSHASVRTNGNASEQELVGFQPERGVLAPVLVIAIFCVGTNLMADGIAQVAQRGDD